MIREYLQMYREAARIAEKLHNEYKKEMDLIDAVRSPMGGDGQPKGGGISKEVEARALRLADKALAWQYAELDALVVRQEIFNMVISVPGDAGDVLHKRYIDLKTFPQIAEEMFVSERHAKRLEADGIEILSQKYKNVPICPYGSC